MLTLTGLVPLAARGLRLRRDKPGHASDELDPLVRGEKASAFLPKVCVRRVHVPNMDLTWPCCQQQKMALCYVHVMVQLDYGGKEASTAKA